MGLGLFSFFRGQSSGKQSKDLFSDESDSSILKTAQHALAVKQDVQKSGFVKKLYERPYRGMGDTSRPSVIQNLSHQLFNESQKKYKNANARIVSTIESGRVTLSPKVEGQRKDSGEENLRYAKAIRGIDVQAWQ